MTAMHFLKPRSVAVIGASRDPSKRGHRAIKTLIDCGYTGQVLPINPKETEILGFACYPDLASVPGEIDLATLRPLAYAGPAEATDTPEPSTRRSRPKLSRNSSSR